MKNIFRILMAVAVLFTASCAKENISSSIGGGEVEVTFTASLPELGTRAFGNGENANILFYNIYEAGTENKLSDLCGSVESNTGVFNVHIVLLKGMQYDLVFWAQNKDCGYYTLNGKQVTAVYEGKNANDDVRDAFYNFIPNFNPANPETTSFALHRPFAQLNAAVKDSDIDAVEASDVDLTTSTVEVDTYSGFNIATGDVTGNKSTVTFVATAVPSTEVFRTGYTLLSMNYLLVPKAGMVSNAAFSFNAKKPSGDAFTFTGTSYNDVPLKQNYRTNILGSLLTKPTDFTVTIDAVFDVPDKDVVQTAAELQQQIENAPDGEETEIVLGGDIDLNDLLASLGTLSTRAAATLPIVIPAEKSIILDLNGCTINAPFEDENAGKHYYAFENRGTLTIKDTKGNGVINARGNFNYGTMTVESGTINATDGNGGYAIRNYEGATFTMNGGTIATTLEDDNQVDKGGYDATTLRVDEGASATINGGVVNNICDFTYAVDNHGDLTIKGGEFTSIHSTIGNNGTMTIDGGSFTCNGLEGITAHCVVAWDGSTTTINGGTFDGKDNFNGFNVDADEGATVYIKGGLFKQVHSGSLYGEGNIVVSGGKFFDEIEDSRLADGCTLVQEGDYWVINFTPAAKIGDAEYGSLQQAIEAVQNGETIIILNDLNDVAFYYNGTASFTIDLNSKTLTSSDDTHMFEFNWNQVANSTPVTINITNGTLISGENTMWTIYSEDTNNVKGTFNLTNLTIDHNMPNYGAVVAGIGNTFNANNVNITTSYGIGFYAAGGEVIMSECSATVNGLHVKPYNSMAFAVCANGKMTINSGVYSAVPVAAADANNQGTSHGSWCGGIMNSGGKLIINGGTFANDNFGDNALATYARGLLLADTGANIQINGGTFNALKAIVDVTNNLGDASRNPSVALAGGDFSADPRISGLYASNLISVAEGYVVTEENGRWILNFTPAAKIGETTYNTLQEAIEAVQNGVTMELNRDITLTEALVIPANKNFTLDLKGKTIVHSDPEGNYAINNLGTLTIEGNGVVTARGIYNGYGNGNENVTTAKLIIENGTFNAKGTNGGAAVYNYGTVEIKGGKFESNGGYGLNNQAGGEISVNNATVNGGIYNVGTLTINNSTIYQHLSGKHAIYNWTGSVTIQGGEFDSLSGNELILADGQDASVVINGGTFNKTAKSWLFGAATGKNISFVINGGTHNGYVNKPEMSVDTIRPYGDPIVVTGGTFNFNPTNWLAEGRAAIEKNGVWTVE